MDRTCEHCRAYAPNGVTCGECRALPPHSIDVHVLRCFPEVLASDWCLAWQAKEKPKAEKDTVPAITSEFDQFWAEFPKKIGKKAAQKAFQNAQDRPSIDDLLEALRKAKRSPQWLKDGGQFIPHPATWLNRGQWSDVPPETKPSVFEEFLARGEGHDEIEG